MDVVASILAILALVALAIYFIKRSGRDSAEPAERRVADTGATSKFHAVSLNISANACEAARNIEGYRYLSGAAPQIPLADCDSQECDCRYVHHADRRSGRDRSNVWGQGSGLDATGQFRAEQRKRTDRRKRPPENGE